MTPQEHFLMMLFFMKQNQSIKVLIDGFKSRAFGSRRSAGIPVPPDD